MAGERGRPKLPDEERRDTGIRVRFTEVEVERVQEAARRANAKTTAAWCRRLILEAADEILEDA